MLLMDPHIGCCRSHVLQVGASREVSNFDARRPFRRPESFHGEQATVNDLSAGATTKQVC